MSTEASTAVLVVDDQPIVTGLLKRMLGALGLTEVESASDGFEALALLRERRFALVIADIGMTPMTGLQLLRAMRADPTLKDVPVLIMTARRDEAPHEEARRARVNGYLTKPFTAETLREAIDRILALWGSQEKPANAKPGSEKPGKVQLGEVQPGRAA